LKREDKEKEKEREIREDGDKVIFQTNEEFITDWSHKIMDDKENTKTKSKNKN